MGSSHTQAGIWNSTAHERAGTVTRHLVPVWQAMLDAVRLMPGMQHLDAGCGSGETSALAMARGASSCGLDCSEAMIDLARRTAPGAAFALGDLERLPYPDACFDAITACNSVHFAADPQAAVRELGRVARPAARIAITSVGTRADLDIRRVVFEPAFTLFDGPPPANPFILSEPGALEAMITGAGLSVVSNLKVLSETRWGDFEAAWAAWRTIGPVNAVMQKVGEDPVREAIKQAAAATIEDGEYVLRDWWHVAVATAG